MQLLHIDASPRADRSRSRAVTQRFLAALPPQVAVQRLDLWDTALPELDSGMIEGRYNLIMGEPVPDEIAARWARVADIVREMMAHDGFLISTPMWNFGLPYRLKHYIDVVTQPGMAFRNDAAGNVEGLAAGKRAVIVAASAMPFGTDAALAGLNFQTRYLEAWLGFIGIEKIDTVHVAPTFGPEDAVAGVMEAASARAEALAREWLPG